MPGTVKPVPEGHRTVAPYLAIKDAARALDLYAKAFGATETYRLMVPDGHLWWVATHREDVPPAEMDRRARDLFAAKA